MSDDILIEGRSYISSRRAAELCGYAQDYVGQLARSGKVDARRVAGLWYVNVESLREHQERADTFVPAPELQAEIRESDSITGTDGIEYISANRASRLSRYNQDYIGQLARSGLIPAQQIGNRWYVMLEPLLAHKREKDSLLAAVQADSVGLSHGVGRSDKMDPFTSSTGTHFSYMSDDKPVFPLIHDTDEVAENVPPTRGADDSLNDGAPRQIPIRVFRSAPYRIAHSDSTRSDMTRKYLVLPGVAVAIVTVMALTYGLASDGRGTASMRNIMQFASVGLSIGSDRTTDSRTSESRTIYGKIRYTMSTVLHYQRAQ